jgi:hypothetical protein
MRAIIFKESSYIHKYAFPFTLTLKLLKENAQMFFFCSSFEGRGQVAAIV